MIFRRKPKSTVTALRAPPASRMQSGRARVMRAAAAGHRRARRGGPDAHGDLRVGGIGEHPPETLPWASGVYLPNATPASVAAFGTWRGAPVDVATVWPTAQLE